MIKAFATDDHAELAASAGQMSQIFERSDKITKSASDAISKADVAAHMPPDTHFGVHLISMGAEEQYGANRNGDSFSDAALKKYHDTFEKFGTVFREHRNRCPKTQGVGQVKLARHNTRMNRGELIVWVDKEKAPDMYKQAKDGKELSWSMSVRLPYDRCSCCDKKSKRTTEYCTHLKSSMLKYVPEFRKYAYARNEDDLKFFDISEVKRRADRIAAALGYTFSPDDMAKAAAEDHLITGAEWAALNGSVEPAYFSPWEAATLEKLARAAEFVRNADDETRRVLAGMVPATLSKPHTDILASGDFRCVAGELAKRAMFIDFPTFAAIVTDRGVDDLRKEASFRDVEGLKLPSLIEDMVRNCGCMCGEDAADAVTPDELGCSLSSNRDAIDNLLDEVGDNLGMKPQPATHRAIVVHIKAASVKQASPMEFDPFYSAMAEAYGYYLVKAAHIATKADGVSEPALLRGIAAMQILFAQKDCQDATSNP
jgi:hypothetical protein